MNSKELKRYRLSHPQSETILLVGGGQVMQESDDGVTVCNQKWNETKAKAYWSGNFQIYDPKRKKSVSLRPKTFQTMEKNGILALAGMLTDDQWATRSLVARLTPLGWDMFDLLAAQRVTTANVWEDAKALILKDEESKGSAYNVEITQKRRVLIAQFQQVDRTLSIVANSPEEAQRLAEEKFAEDMASGELSWDNDYWASAEDWPAYAEDGDTRLQRNKMVEVTDQKPLKIGEASSRNYGADTVTNRVNRRCSEELGRKPQLWDGLIAYVNEGQKPAWIQQQLAAEFGGRLVTVPDLEDNEPEPEDNGEVDADLGRFQGFFDED